MESVIRSGLTVHYEDSIFDRSGDIDRFAVLTVDVTESHRTQLQVEGLNRMRESLLAQVPLEEKLHRVTDGLVEIFDADFSRIWVIRPGDRVLSPSGPPAGVTGPVQQADHLARGVPVDREPGGHGFPGDRD